MTDRRGAGLLLSGLRQRSDVGTLAQGNSVQTVLVALLDELRDRDAAAHFTVLDRIPALAIGNHEDPWWDFHAADAIEMAMTFLNDLAPEGYEFRRGRDRTYGYFPKEK